MKHVFEADVDSIKKIGADVVSMICKRLFHWERISFRLKIAPYTQKPRAQVFLVRCSRRFSSQIGDKPAPHPKREGRFDLPARVRRGLIPPLAGSHSLDMKWLETRHELARNPRVPSRVARGFIPAF